MATTPLMGRAREQTTAASNAGASFTPKDPREFVPPEQHDTVDRIVAAGMKVMYSPQMADERQAAIEDQAPVPKRIADNITGLMLTLDQKSKSGIPEVAIFPAATMLTNEAANLLVNAGQNVTQDDYNESLQIMYVQLGKKLGFSDDQLMQGAQDALAKSQGGMDPTAQAASTGAPVAPDPADAMPQNAGQSMPAPPEAMP